MNWKLKARIQTLIARLPEAEGQACYYWVQRASGSFRRPEGGSFASLALTLRRHIERQHGTVGGATFLEVGTGRRLTLPVLLWLLGAERIITVDLHRYLRQSVVALDLRALMAEVPELPPAHPWLPDRWRALRDLLGSAWGLTELAKLCSIEYQAPADAARLDLPSASTSSTWRARTCASF
jgi:hypothetical protein